MTSIRLLLLLAWAGTAWAENWPCWRGPRGDGSSLEANVPIRWSPESNIVWKVEVAGVGHASPIVWDNQLFLVSAVNDARSLFCLDRTSGKVVWTREVLNSPLEKKHSLNSHASSTPATDGRRVYVSFLEVDEMVVAAYDLSGKQEWLVRPGKFRSMHGYCSAPLLFEGRVLVNGDHDGDSYLVALDAATGRTLWKTPRENKTRSYCVPLIRELAGRTQMVLTGDKCVASYDPRTGSRHWVIDGPTEQFVASPVYSEKSDLLIITGGYPDHHILAIRPDGLGNVSKTHIAWRTTRGAAYVPSPIISGDYFLIVSDQGFANCVDVATGKLHWQERLGEHHASLVSAGGLVYFLNDNGQMNVVRPGPDFDRVARNELGERCFASPAISHGQMFIRSDRHLFCIGQPAH